MSLYLGTTEITKLRDLAPQTGLDITDIWFGGTNVYTVWQTYEGTLPATLSANGDNLRQYQVWGNVGGVGDVTENLFDYTKLSQNERINENGDISYISSWGVSDYINVNPSTTYAAKGITAGGNLNACHIAIYDSDKQFLSSVKINTTNPITVNIPEEGAFVRLNVRYVENEASTTAMFTEGTTPPASFVPFGYEVDMVSRTRNLLNFSTVQNNLTIDAVAGLPVGYNGRIATLTPINVSTVSAVTITYNSDYSGIYFMYSVLTADNTMLIRKISKQNGDTIEIPAGGAKLYISWYGAFNITTDDITQVMVSVNPSDKYQPYSNTTTPIYIGSNPLDKDEYISYAEGKIYRLSENLWNVNGRTTNQNGDERSGNEFEAGEIYKITNESSSTIYYRLGTETTTATAISAGVSVNITATDKLLVWSPAQSLMPYITAQRVGVPTDPPVALPALPTCEGETIIDYAGSETAPEKVLLKYRKE